MDYPFNLLSNIKLTQMITIQNVLANWTVNKLNQPMFMNLPAQTLTRAVVIQ